MKYNYLLFLFFTLLFSCNPPEENKSKEAITLLPESNTTSPQNKEPSPPFVAIASPLDHGKLIYLDLFFKNEKFVREYEKITRLTDSIIVNQPDLTRKRLPLEIAKKYFLLNFPKELSVMNENNNKVARGTFAHVEYMETMIEGKFIAVFELNDTIKYPDEDFYCIPEEVTPDKGFSTKKVNYKIDSEEETISSKDIKASPSGIIFSLDAVKGSKGNIFHRIYVSNNDSTWIAFEKNSTDTMILDFLPTAVQYNSYPVMILKMGIPDTDNIWYETMIFNDERYLKVVNRK